MTEEASGQPGLSAVQRLSEREQQYRQIFDATSDGLVINDPVTGVVVEANPAFCRMHGYTYEELIGLHPTTFIHPEDRRLFDDYVAAVSEQHDFLARARDVRKDGTVFDVEVHGTRFRFRGRDHILGVVRDITVEVQAKTAALEERYRIARDLHDSVSQSLFSLTLQARTAELALARAGIDPNGELGRPLLAVGELSRGALAEMRALIFELRPGALAEEGLGAALAKHAAAVTAREGLDIAVAAPEERLPIPPDQEEQLYRIAQEAIHNAVKHAKASTVAVTLSAEQHRRIRLSVSDDGAGFDPADTRPGHLGLHTMHERAEALGAELSIESGPARGTTISIELRVAPATSL